MNVCLKLSDLLIDKVMRGLAFRMFALLTSLPLQCLLFYCQCCLSSDGKQGFEFYTTHNLGNGQHTIYFENFGQLLMRDLLSVLRNEAKL